MQKRRPNKAKNELLGDLNTYYYSNQDMRLLLDLLAQNAKNAASLRVLALFDKEFRIKFKPGDLDISILEYHTRVTEINTWNDEGRLIEHEEKNQVYDVRVQFSEPPALVEIFPYVKGCSFGYTAEIRPPTSKTAIVYFTKVDFKIKDANDDLEEGDKNETDETSDDKTVLNSNLLQAIFRDLDISTEYTIIVNALLNGTKAGQRIERINPKLA